MLLLAPVLAGTINLGLYLAGQATGRDFHAKMADWVQTLLPGESTGKEKGKAWDSRVDSIRAELEAFSDHPLTGRGFAWHQDYIFRGNINWGAFNHNAWTAIMANTGIFGLIAMSTTVGVMIYLGRRLIVDAVDRPSMLFGVVGYLAGVTFALYGICTMVFQARGALHFALLCGMLIRAREIQETTRALAAAQPEAPPELEAEPGFATTGVPDWQF